MTLSQDQKLQQAIDSSVEDVITNLAEQCDVYVSGSCPPQEGVDLIAKGVKIIYLDQVVTAWGDQSAPR